MYLSLREKAAAALAAFAIVLLMAAALILGLRAGALVTRAQALLSFNFTPPPKKAPPPAYQPKKAERPAAKGAPSPRNLKNEATQIVALPVPLLITPPPVTVAPKANVGNAAASGASDLPGPGQGAGGIGDGFGGGGYGGDGDGGDAEVGPRQIRGKLSYSDLPDEFLEGGGTAVVSVRYAVNVNGRVSDCEAIGSSGVAALDTLTCRLIEQRFRFRPARNGAGRPVLSYVEENHTWVVEQVEPPELPQRRRF